MRDYDEDVPYIVIERSGSGMVPFIFGALLGGAAALLFAPKSGEETQQELRERAKELRDKAEKKFGEFEVGFQEAVDEGRRQVGEKLETAKRAVDEGRSRAQEAVEAGRRAAEQARSEFDKRVARDSEEDQGGEEPATD